MNDQIKPYDLKGMLNRDTPVSIEEMNDAICEQGAAAAPTGPEDSDTGVGDTRACSETHRSIGDMLNDSEGNDIEYEPPKLEIRIRPAEE